MSVEVAVSRRAHTLLQNAWMWSSCRRQTATVAARRTLSSRSVPTTTFRGRGQLRPNQAWQKAASRRVSTTSIIGGRRSKLPREGTPVRTRFAPSPTGYLHIGGLRTALFSYLLAKRCGGQFVLRIEDTDQKRLVDDAEQRLIEDLRWTGLNWDEGPDIDGPYGPYRQSERNEIYQKHARELVDNDTAYRCFCTPQTAGNAKAAYVTSGCYQSCSSLSANESRERADSGREAFTIRLHPPTDAGKRVYPDLTYGRVQRLKRSPSAALTPDDETGISAADTILMKSDGTPTYHFANVVDDHLMRITHVIRGEEWLASTPLHFDIYEAFGWTPPLFAHVGLLVDEGKAKLSKRSANLVLDVRSMREQHHVLPSALNNFLVLLGWSNPTTNDVLDMQELARLFDLKFTRGNSMVKMDKLWFLQKHHLVRLAQKAEAENSLEPIREVVEVMVTEVKQRYATFTPPVRNGTAISLASYCAEVLTADVKNFQTIEKHVDRNGYFFRRPLVVTNPFPMEQTQVLKLIAAGVLHETNTAQGATSSGEQNPATSTSESVNLHERNIHAALVKHTWLAVLPQVSDILGNPTMFANPDLASLDIESKPEAMAKKILQNISTSKVSRKPNEEDNLLLTRTYKSLNRDLMRFLRLRLCNGEPGPGMSITMAILGHEECCARLDLPLTTAHDKGEFETESL